VFSPRGGRPERAPAPAFCEGAPAVNPFEPLRWVNTPELVCPYCYSTFAERDILFRCTGLPGPEGRTCPIGKDTALETHLGRNEHLPPVFAHDGRLRSEEHTSELQ